MRLPYMPPLQGDQRLPVPEGHVSNAAVVPLQVMALRRVYPAAGGREHDLGSVRLFLHAETRKADSAAQIARAIYTRPRQHACAPATDATQQGNGCGLE